MSTLATKKVKQRNDLTGGLEKGFVPATDLWGIIIKVILLTYYLTLSRTVKSAVARLAARRKDASLPARVRSLSVSASTKRLGAFSQASE